MTTCREIHANDIDRVVALLSRGFGGEPYWARAMRRLTDHPAPSGVPKYGFVLEDGEKLVGVVLLVHTDLRFGGKTWIRCNVSSWYVDPAYRSYASILARRATRLPNVTYFNVTPAPHTWGILEAQGFRPLAAGRTLAVPALNPPRFGTRVYPIPAEVEPDRNLDQAEIDLLLRHEAYGCLSLICEADGQRHPFVFGLERRRGFLRIAHLVYCRSLKDFIQFAGPIGRYLMVRGIGFVELHSNGQIPGLAGRYSVQRKYVRGDDRMHPGDVAYSELVMFGYPGSPGYPGSAVPANRPAARQSYVFSLRKAG